MVGELAMAGRAASTRREYVQIFKGSIGSCRPARLPRSRPRSGRGWCARWMSSTRPGTWRRLAGSRGAADPRSG